MVKTTTNEVTHQGLKIIHGERKTNFLQKRRSRQDDHYIKDSVTNGFFKNKTEVKHCIK